MQPLAEFGQANLFDTQQSAAVKLRALPFLRLKLMHNSHLFAIFAQR